ncbi:hypothetical protein BGX38DRAFT_1272879 [Terfezia claveryi]|nr:hypothetical protein BGX38DRAFT_1272879 [Terfezia claveryi]
MATLDDTLGPQYGRPQHFPHSHVPSSTTSTLRQPKHPPSVGANLLATSDTREATPPASQHLPQGPDSGNDLLASDRLATSNSSTKERAPTASPQRSLQWLQQQRVLYQWQQLTQQRGAAISIRINITRDGCTVLGEDDIYLLYAPVIFVLLFRNFSEFIAYLPIFL